MNEHLAPIFDEVIPVLSGAGIRSWVYGGVGVAGVAGQFIRHNDDVDVYVLGEDDYAAACDSVEKWCDARPQWSAKPANPNLHGRPKLNLFHLDQRYPKGRLELFSVVPVYKTSSGIEFRFKTPLTLPLDAIANQMVAVERYRFLSSPPNVIRTIFDSFLSEQPWKFTSAKSGRRIDGEYLYPNGEFAKRRQRAEEALASERKA